MNAKIWGAIAVALVLGACGKQEVEVPAEEAAPAVEIEVAPAPDAAADAAAADAAADAAAADAAAAGASADAAAESAEEAATPPQ